VKSLSDLVDELNQAGIDSGIALGKRGTGEARIRELTQIECQAGWAVEERIKLIRAMALDRPDVLDLIDGDGS
jgi:hypothetical protein